MKALKRIALVAIAGFGVLAQAQAQDYANKFNDAKPEIEGLMQSMQFKEAVGKIREILPSEIPAFPRDPANLQVTLAGYSELGSIQNFHDYLYRALRASGDTEGAIACAKKAEEIAKKNAADTEDGLAPTVESYTAVVRESTKKLDEAAAAKGQLEAEKDQLQAEKEMIEAKAKKATKADKQRLPVVVERLAAIEEELAALGKDVASSENDRKMANGAINQLNGIVNAAKKGAAKFAKSIEDMEGSLAVEQEAIAKFKGNKANYVKATLPNAKDMDQKEKVRFLGRLSVLDPKNKEVQKQLAAAIPGKV